MHTFCIYTPESSNTEYVPIHNYRAKPRTEFSLTWGQPFGWSQSWDQPFGWGVGQLFGRAQEYDGRSES